MGIQLYLKQMSLCIVCIQTPMRQLHFALFFFFPAYITLKIKVRLNIGFQEDLKNSSSALYRSYKTDLERAVGLSSWSHLPEEMFGWSKRSPFPWTGCFHVCNLSEVMQTHLRRGIEKYSNQRAFRGQDITLASQLTLFPE